MLSNVGKDHFQNHEARVDHYHRTRVSNQSKNLNYARLHYIWKLVHSLQEVRERETCKWNCAFRRSSRPKSLWRNRGSEASWATSLRDRRNSRSSTGGPSSVRRRRRPGRCPTPCCRTRCAASSNISSARARRANRPWQQPPPNQSGSRPWCHLAAT